MGVMFNPGGTFPRDPNNPGPFNQNPVRTQGFGTRMFGSTDPAAVAARARGLASGRGAGGPGPNVRNGPVQGSTNPTQPNPNTGATGSTPWQVFNAPGSQYYNPILPTFDPNSVLANAPAGTTQANFDTRQFFNPSSPYYTPYLPSNFFGTNYNPAVWNPNANLSPNEQKLLANAPSPIKPGQPLTGGPNTVPNQGGFTPGGAFGSNGQMINPFMLQLLGGGFGGGGFGSPQQNPFQSIDWGGLLGLGGQGGFGGFGGFGGGFGNNAFGMGGPGGFGGMGGMWPFLFGGGNFNPGQFMGF